MLGKNGVLCVVVQQTCIDDVIQAEKQCVPFIPTLMVHTCPSTAAEFAESYDKVCMQYGTILQVCVSVATFAWLQYGDSYTEDVTEESLKYIFKKMQDQVHKDTFGTCMFSMCQCHSCTDMMVSCKYT